MIGRHCQVLLLGKTRFDSERLVAIVIRVICREVCCFFLQQLNVGTAIHLLSGILLTYLQDDLVGTNSDGLLPLDQQTLLPSYFVDPVHEDGVVEPSREL